MLIQLLRIKTKGSSLVILPRVRQEVHSKLGLFLKGGKMNRLSWGERTRRRCCRPNDLKAETFMYNGWRGLSSTVCIRLPGTSAVLTLSRGPEISPSSWREPLFPTAWQKWLHTSHEPLPGEARAAPSACVCKWGAVRTLWGEYPWLPALLLRKKNWVTYLACVCIPLGFSEGKQSWQVGLRTLVILSPEDMTAVWAQSFVLE